MRTPIESVDVASRDGALEATVRVSATSVIGWQLYDPQTNLFLSEGEWHDVGQGETAALRIDLPPEPGEYAVYLSRRDAERGWDFALGLPFWRIATVVDNTGARVVDSRLTTLRRLRWRNLPGRIADAFRDLLETVTGQTNLIRSLVRRDVMARYRGSFGDIFWTLLNPLLLMVTYLFVFGVVLRARFPADPTTGGFALYFLAGMLPWLAVSEPAGRSPVVLHEHRNLIRRMVFPSQILSLMHTLSGLTTGLLATAVFLVTLWVMRGAVPLSVVWLPVLLVPQVLFTAGLCWILAALGAYVRDLGHVIGFAMTLWFFITPICYPESSLPPEIAPLLAKNPIYVLVRAYREILLEGHAPSFAPLAKLYVVALAVFVAGHTMFYRLKRNFPDIL